MRIREYEELPSVSTSGALCVLTYGNLKGLDVMVAIFAKSILFDAVYFLSCFRKWKIAP